MAVWAIIPAAGSGQRFGGRVPKQYLEVAGKPLLGRVLELFLSAPGIDAVVLATAVGDARWQALVPGVAPRPLIHAIGGATRAASVLSALDAIETHAQRTDWALVHDAARPCLSMHDLDRLLRTLAQDPVGGLLATPVVDTLKQADVNQRVLTTTERTGLWRALTPQMFRYELLRGALRAALSQGVDVTDEASAMEKAGHAPRLVKGAADNIKVTRREDLALAEVILRTRE